MSEAAFIERVRYRAYMQFINEGRRHGRALAHWLEALHVETELARQRYRGFFRK